MDYKEFIGIIAVVLTFGGYAPYIRDIFKGKTIPHTFTWFIWTLAVSISAALQLSGGAGIGAGATIAVALICIFIFLLSLQKGKNDITSTDIAFFILAIASLFLWIVVHKPIWSIILAVTTDLLGFVPTIRKSWAKPYSETLSTYEITALRHALSLFALRQFNVLTWLYPAAWTVANIFFSLFLIARRKAVGETK